MATLTVTNTFVPHTQPSAASMNTNFTDVKTVVDALVDTTSAQTVGGIKTFSAAIKASSYIELANISDPTAVTGKVQVYAKAGELYFQDPSGNKTQITASGALYGAPTTTVDASATLATNATLSITHTSDTTYKRDISFLVYDTDHWNPAYDGTDYEIKLTDTTTSLKNLTVSTVSVRGRVTIYA